MALETNSLYVRDFTFGDEPALQAVFYSAIHTIAASDYTPAQLDAWAPGRPDMERWTARMRAIRPFVVEEDGRIVGYADLQANGFIDHFYVSGSSARRGVGRILMDHIHSRAAQLALASLFSDVSRTAQPFFERFGFLIFEHKTAIVGGVSLPNARMTKDLLALSMSW
jgi:putative acetyltransferase